MLIPFDYLFHKYKIKPTGGVLHLGAHHGQESQAYQEEKVPRVIWVEAVPEAFRVLKKNVGHLKGNLCLWACVGDKDGEEVTFNVANNGQSSSYLKLGTHRQAHPEVKYVREFTTPTIRVDTLLEEARIKLEGGWFLNCDLQGAELKALKGMGDLLWHFHWVYIEVNEKELYVGCPLIDEIDSYLKQYNLVRRETKMSGRHGWGDAIYTRFQ